MDDLDAANEFFRCPTDATVLRSVGEVLVCQCGFRRDLPAVPQPTDDPKIVDFPGR